MPQGNWALELIQMEQITVERRTYHHFTSTLIVPEIDIPLPFVGYLNGEFLLTVLHPMRGYSL